MRARGLHGRRRVPLPRARRGARGRRGGGRGRRRARPSCSPPTRAAGCRACGRSRSPTTCASSSRCARTASASASPPTPSAPARATGSRSSAATPSPSGCRCTSTRREQPREVEECLAEHGCRPIELLARTGCLGPRTTVVHATHADGAELDLLAEADATVCACLTTEADLGDGFLPAARIDHRRIALCIGSDSNVRIDPLEELRELEGIARRQTGSRGVFRAERLLCFGADEGGRSLGLESWPEIEIDLGHVSLRGVADGGRLRRARRRLRRRRRQRRLNATSSTQTAPWRLGRLDRDPREDGAGGCARAHGHASPALPDRERHARRRPPNPPKIAVEPVDREPQIACDVLSPDPGRCSGALPRSRRAVDGSNRENTGTDRRPARCETRRRPARSCDRCVPRNPQVAQRQHGPLRRKNRSVRGSRRLLEAPVEACVTRAG